MPSARPDLPVRYFEGRDGTALAYRELGAGRPLVLVHGYFSTAFVNWVRYGHAETIAARGHRVIMPDLRAHGDSAKPHDPASYPPDVLADDGLALLDHLGLNGSDDGYDLGGYSLGARTVARMLVRGALPGRAVIAGMGLEPIVEATTRGESFRRILTNLGTFPQGSPEWRSEAFLETVGGDPVALLNLLDTAVDTPVEALAAIPMPVLVLAGVDDGTIGSVQGLADVLPAGEYVAIPGNHMSAVAKPQLGTAIADFLSPR